MTKARSEKTGLKFSHPSTSSLLVKLCGTGGARQAEEGQQEVEGAKERMIGAEPALGRPRRPGTSPP